MEPAVSNASPSASLGIGPRLATLSNYPIWQPKMSLYIQSLRQNGLSDVICRKKLLDSLPDAESFHLIGRIQDILFALETSYRNCFFQSPSCDRSWTFEDICQYSCCEHCALIKTSVASLAHYTLPNKVSIRKRCNAFRIGGVEYPLLMVSIIQPAIDKTAQRRTFDIILRGGKSKFTEANSVRLCAKLYTRQQMVDI